MMKEIEINLHEIGITAFRCKLIEEDAGGNEMLRRLQVRLAGEKQDPYVIERPASWWQMFKEQSWIPTWFRRRFPVKRITTELSVATIYPFLKTTIPPDLMGSRFIGRFKS